MVKYQVAEQFAALSDENRLRMLEVLAVRGPLPLSSFTHTVRISLPAVSKHARILARAGFITQEKRGRETVCSLDRRAWNEMIEWFLSHHQFWNASFDRLEKLIHKEQ